MGWAEQCAQPCASARVCASHRLTARTARVCRPAVPTMLLLARTAQLLAKAAGGWVLESRITTSAPKGDCFVVITQVCVNVGGGGGVNGCVGGWGGGEWGLRVRSPARVCVLRSHTVKRVSCTPHMW